MLSLSNENCKYIHICNLGLRRRASLWMTVQTTEAMIELEIWNIYHRFKKWWTAMLVGPVFCFTSLLPNSYLHLIIFVHFRLYLKRHNFNTIILFDRSKSIQTCLFRKGLIPHFWLGIIWIVIVWHLFLGQKTHQNPSFLLPLHQ